MPRHVISCTVRYTFNSYHNTLSFQEIHFRYDYMASKQYAIEVPTASVTAHDNCSVIGFTYYWYDVLLPTNYLNFRWLVIIFMSAAGWRWAQLINDADFSEPRRRYADRLHYISRWEYRQSLLYYSPFVLHTQNVWNAWLKCLPSILMIFWYAFGMASGMRVWGFWFLILHISSRALLRSFAKGI